MPNAPRKPRAKKKPAAPATKPETVLVLRTCRADMSSSHGFIWPQTGPVSAPDWNSDPVCGYGLHGWLWGEGDAATSGFLHLPDAKWLVVEVEAALVVDLSGKVKFPRGTVVCSGPREIATAHLAERAPGRAIIGLTATAGARGTATAGYAGTATAGYAGTATAGARGTATAGARGTIQIRWWDGQAERYRTATAYVGEDGIEACVPYRLDAEHRFVKAVS